MQLKHLAQLTTRLSEEDDQAAFSELYIHFFPGLISYVFTILGDKSLAEDVVQDVFVKIWNNRKTLPAISNFSYYLYTAAKHTSFNHLVKNKTTTEYLSYANNKISLHQDDPELAAIHKENIKLIESAINSLPERCRLVFRLIKEEGLKYKEVSQLLELSQKTVEAHMRMAHSRILQAITTHLPEYAFNLEKIKNKKNIVP